MRLTLGLLLMALVLYLAGASIMSALAKPVRHTWSGTGNGPPIHFSMPAGPLPGVLSHPWMLHYQVDCHGLKRTPGAPPDTYAYPTFSVSLRGAEVIGTNAGGEDAEYTGHASRGLRSDDGGSYTLVIRARPTCAWKLRASTG